MHAWQKQEKSSKQKDHMQRIQSSYHSDQNCDVFGRYAEENIIPFRYDQYSISGGNRKQFFSKRAKYYAEAYLLPSAAWDLILVQILTFVSSLVRIQNRKESLPLTDMRYISGWVESLPLTNMRYKNGWVESLLLRRKAEDFSIYIIMRTR